MKSKNLSFLIFAVGNLCEDYAPQTPTPASKSYFRRITNVAAGDFLKQPEEDAIVRNK